MQSFTEALDVLKEPFGWSGGSSIVDVFWLHAFDLSLQRSETIKVVLSVEEFRKRRQRSQHKRLKLMALDVGDETTVVEDHSERSFKRIAAA